MGCVDGCMRHDIWVDDYIYVFVGIFFWAIFLEFFLASALGGVIEGI
jgi:hypothetical protein